MTPKIFSGRCGPRVVSVMKCFLFIFLGHDEFGRTFKSSCAHTDEI